MLIANPNNISDTNAAPELAEFNPTAVLESAVGPFVEYERQDPAEYVDGFIPDGWSADYTNQIKLASGRYRAPLVPDEDRVRPLSLVWGSWPVPASAPIAWGARAIYRLDTTDTKHRMVGGRKKLVQRASTTAVIELLHDRQGSAAREGVTDAERAALASWINKVAMPELRKQCARQYITPDSDAIIEIERDGYKLVAGPRASYGYLYIRTWKVA